MHARTQRQLAKPANPASYRGCPTFHPPSPVPNYTQTRTHTHSIRSYIFTPIHAYTHACVHACMPSCIHSAAILTFIPCYTVTPIVSPAHIGPCNAGRRAAPETTPLWTLLLIKLSLSFSLSLSQALARTAVSAGHCATVTGRLQYLCVYYCRT